jgi:hypothetical protein
MTGADVKLRFETQIDDIYTDYFSNSQINRFFQTAANTVTNDLLKDFESNRIDYARLLPLINRVVATPTSNTIDIAQDSTDVPSCKQVVFIEPSFGTSTVVRATPLSLKDFGAIYSAGSVRYPKYTMINGSLLIYPSTTTCTSCVVWYIRNPFYIDVADNSALIPYNDEMVELLIKGAVIEATRSTREYNMSNIDTQILNSEIK